MTDSDMRSFGERFGSVTAPVLPLEDVTKQFRVAVWNELHALMQAIKRGPSTYPVIALPTFIRNLATKKHWIVADLPDHEWDQVALLKNWLLEGAVWWEVYELIEEAPSLGVTYGSDRDNWPHHWNKLLEREGSPYRFIGTRLTPVTGKEELASIASAAEPNAKFHTAAEHIRNAISQFGKRPLPDYANTAKEALLALESAVCIATDQRPGDMGGALRKFREKFGVHGALTQSASNLFGYGSDEGGVRHGKVDKDSSVDFEDALLVLVTASAWVNYVKQVASRGASGT